MTDSTKPVRRRVELPRVPYGMSNRIIVTIYPGGTIGLRENKRRREYRLDVAGLYTRAVIAVAAVERAERKKARKVARKLRNGL